MKEEMAVGIKCIICCVILRFPNKKTKYLLKIILFLLSLSIGIIRDTGTNLEVNQNGSTFRTCEKSEVNK
jgi:hypothetical protein